MLIIQPIGGLCNRMRAINSAKVLADKRGESLLVIWFVNPELGCPFEALFDKPKDFAVMNIYSKWNLKKLFFQFTRKRIGNEELRTTRVDGNLPESYVSKLPKNLFIATEEHFFVSHDYSNFIPTKEIADKVNDITSAYGKHCIGVHIRRTDNKPAIGKSSTDAFVSAIQKELNLDPSTMFYLATDDMAEEKNLRALFPDKIISNETRDLSRNSIAGVKDALIDLTCLSKTDKIIGSFFSSFTDIAADMRGIPKIVAGEEE